MKCLYLNGSGAHATTPTVDFGQTSFTIASWVKLQSPVNDPSTIYGYWKNPHHFRLEAYLGGNLLFQVQNSDKKIGQILNKGEAFIYISLSFTTERPTLYWNTHVKNNTNLHCFKGLRQKTNGFMPRRSGTERQKRLICSLTVRVLGPRLCRAT